MGGSCLHLTQELTTNRAPSQYWLKETNSPRIYYSQVFWAFGVRLDPTTGKTQYCLMQRSGANPDEYWADASVCRQITPEKSRPFIPMRLISTLL